MIRAMCRICLCAIVVLLATLRGTALGDVILVGPTPYLSTADIPSGFYLGGFTGLEDFEDGILNFGITASAGTVLNPSGVTDSVDADDGLIDGSGTGGHSWFLNPGSTGVTFTFSGPLPTAAAIVWTDGFGTTTFEAFDSNDVSLGTISATIADGSFFGTTAEDSFFGVKYENGIKAIKVSNSSGGIELDHLQFGIAAVPEPSSLAFLSMVVFGLLGRRNRVVPDQSCP